MYSTIVAGDLRLVASQCYGMAITRPRVTCRHYSIPLLRRRPPGLHKLYMRKGKETEGSTKQSCHRCTCTNAKVPLLIGTTHSELFADRVHGETTPPLGCNLEVV